MADMERGFVTIFRHPRPFFGWTLLIGMGVLTVWCGVGFLLMWAGASELLRHAAVTAGFDKPTHGRMAAAGAVALGMALTIAVAAVIGVGTITGPELASGQAVLAAVVAVLVIGAVLAPIAFLPIAILVESGTKRSAFGRAIDAASSDRLVMLAPLASLIAALVFLPIPSVAGSLGFALNGDHGFQMIVVAGLAVWLFGVPWSAATLTQRYAALRGSEREASGVGEAARPVIGAVAIGAFAVLAALLAQLTSPDPVRVGRPAPGALVMGKTVVLRPGDGTVRPPATDVGVGLSAYDAEWLVVDSPRGESWHRLGQPLPHDCEVGRLRAGGIAMMCGDGDEARYVQLDAFGVPAPPPPLQRITVGAASGVAMLLALALVGLALVVLGRFSRSVRLLAARPFLYRGSFAGEASMFTSDDGAHRLRVPRRQLEDVDAESHEGAAVLVSPRGLPSIGLRSAEVPCPAGALLVVGSLETAIATRTARARSLGFRFAAAALVPLVVAAVALAMRC
ncbi:MAG: hypothetical protein AB7S26_02955 [Sandaracinaceae bacterium]